MEAALFEIKPNANKLFMFNFVLVFVLAFFIIGTVIYFIKDIGVGVIAETLAVIGVSVSPSALILWTTIIIVLLASLFLIVSYATISKMRYTVYPDKIVCNSGTFISNLETTIPFDNIVRISFGDKSLLRTTSVTLDLTGTKDKSFELKEVENAEETVKRIHEAMREHKAKFYAQYTQQYRVNSIMEHF